MKVSHHRITSTLPEPFVSHTGVTSRVDQDVVELTWQGHTGRGTARGAVGEVLARCAPLLADATPADAPTMADRMVAEGLPAPAACAVDIALHDLLGRVEGLPLARLWGIPDVVLLPTARTIGASSDAALRHEAAWLVDWPVLKLKLTPSDDGSRAGVLRSVYPGRIRVDGNGSWSVMQALRVIEELARHDVELVEQPIAPGRLDELGEIHQRSPLPLFADEDCLGPDDVARLAGLVDGVNIKLVKTGGLQRARRAIDRARQHGLSVMLGSKLESSLGVTAMAQLAGLADHLDLDGHLLLLDDPFTGIQVDHGVIEMPTGPGTGAELRRTDPCETTVVRLGGDAL